MASDPSEAEKRLTGRNGERLVYQVLLQNFASEINKRDVDVIWVNQDEETGLPYDIKIMKRKNDEYIPVKYIEVKSTKSIANRPFKMSSSELRFAFHYGLSYDVYRVSGIGEDNYLKIKHLPGFATHLDGWVAAMYISV